ncbi:hypothetical protein EUTSA_v10009279mg [Eutrema salsugineum]|uniref:Uncharacterized protein n=1 Tax=Eutrema salsugineum TaxID=72664 RepID=V4KUZ9_EUTSA|nr:hypothetical protein EUTSA_v10009279mg [Eutrema salsugineum]
MWWLDLTLTANDLTILSLTPHVSNACLAINQRWPSFTLCNNKLEKNDTNNNMGPVVRKLRPAGFRCVS